MNKYSNIENNKYINISNNPSTKLQQAMFDENNTMEEYKNILKQYEEKQIIKKANRIAIKNETKKRLERFNKVDNNLVLNEIKNREFEIRKRKEEQKKYIMNLRERNTIAREYQLQIPRRNLNRCQNNN